MPQHPTNPNPTDPASENAAVGEELVDAVDKDAMLTPLPSEALIIGTASDEAPWAKGKTALVISPGRAQLATTLLQASFDTVQAWYLDLHDAGLTQQFCPAEVDVLCGADLPEGEYDLVAMPILKRGEAELTRDLLQQSHQRLTRGGFLLVGVNNPKDTWVHDQLRNLFDKVTSVRSEHGCVYWAKKTNDLKKIKDFRCQFSFKDGDNIIQVVSRPGVFSHRRLDLGAKQLLNSVAVEQQDNVLDMGCGAGTIALAVAKQTTGQVYGVDANARAVQCLGYGAELNGLSNVTPVWNADGNILQEQEIDLALANPPYFGNDLIAQHFVDTSVSALRPGGALLVVTKQAEWYHAYFSGLLEDIEFFENSRYSIACGRKPLVAS